jgi:hypothetical protein
MNPSSSTAESSNHADQGIELTRLADSPLVTDKNASQVSKDEHAEQAEEGSRGRSPALDSAEYNPREERRITSNLGQTNSYAGSRGNHSTNDSIQASQSTDETEEIQPVKSTAQESVEESSAEGFPFLPGGDYVQISTEAAVRDGHAKLDFKPFAIQTWFLIFTIFVFLACIGGIVAMIILGHYNQDGFHIHQTANHLAYRYVPAAIGTVTTIWWRTIISTLGRMTPYISLAAQSETDGKQIRRTLSNAYAFGNVYADNITIRDMLKIARNGHLLLLTSLYVQRIMVAVIVPLKAAFLQIVADGDGWTIIVLPHVGYALIGIYAILIVLTIGILIRTWNRGTGLKWDPVSVADQLALFQGSNILQMYQGLEFANANECIKVLMERGDWFGHLRLGYWKRGGSIWHGIACIPPQTGKSTVHLVVHTPVYFSI